LHCSLYVGGQRLVTFDVIVGVYLNLHRHLPVVSSVMLPSRRAYRTRTAIRTVRLKWIAQTVPS
jgi:hypothetical protein